MKNIRRMMLGLCLVIGLVCGNALIVQAEEEGDYEYSVDNTGNATIIRYRGNDTEITTPAQIGGYTVNKLNALLFHDNNTIKSVKVSEGVTDIGQFAFDGCENLEEIILPSTLLTINKYTFEKCSSLKNIEIPESVTKIGLGAFKECSSLTKVEIPKNVSSIGGGLFQSCTNLLSLTVSSDNAVYYSKDNCIITKVKNVLVCAANVNVVPQEVTQIGYSAFCGDQSLTHIELPVGLTRIKDMAFAGSGLQDIILPGTVTDIDNGAFSCNLSSIEIPPSVTYMNEGVFDGIEIEIASYSASKTNDDAGNKKYRKTIIYRTPGSYADRWVEDYNVSNLEWFPPYRKAYVLAEDNCRVVVLSEGDTPEAQYCNPITKDAVEYTIPDTVTVDKVSYRVTSIADHAFAECSNVEKITLGRNVTQIAPDAFVGIDGKDDKLELVIPEEVEDISNMGITNISNVNNITINVAAGSQAEIYLQQFNTIHYYTYPPTQKPDPGQSNSQGTTDGKQDTTENVPSKPDDITVSNPTVDTQPVSAPVIGQIYIVGQANYLILSSDQVSFSGSANKKIKTLKIPDTVTINGRLYRVTAIEKQAMKGCAKLQTVVIGNQVTAIGEKAFCKCKKLQKVTIGSQVTKIGKGAFSGDKKLKRMILKGSKVTKIGKKALKGVPKRIRITAPKKCVSKYKKLLNAAK